MPFIDLNLQSPDSFPYEYSDIVIVGAGAAGILLAVNLAKAGREVLILESGHVGEDENKQRLNEVRQTGKTLNNAIWGRKRAIGGTTIAWGGQSLPFNPLDFVRREWVNNSGWPISMEELVPFYKDANAFMGIDRLDYKNDIFPGIFLKDPGFDTSVVEYHVSKWANQPDFHLLYKDYLEKNVTLLYNAHLLGINRKDNGAIDAVSIANFNGKSFTCKPGTLIIAAGGIETVRVLLNNGLGDHSGLLGKYFMEHPYIEVGDVSTDNPYRLQRCFNTHTWQGRKYSLRLSLNESFQRQNQLLNCSASIMFVPVAEKFDPYAELRLFKKDFRPRRLLRVFGSSGSIVKSIWAYSRDRFYYKVNALGKLALLTEQEPIKESYISLCREKDEFGIPKAEICWNITPGTWRTVQATSKAIKAEIERLHIGRVSLYPHVIQENSEWADYLSDVNHHMGGCRMSSSPGEGVVNKDLQVWNVPNLYLCSCAVFPTSSHSNPTLTLLSLGLRLNKHLAIKKD